MTPGVSSLREMVLVSPYFPPSTLAGVHRARHLAKHLPAWGWKPIVLCVDEAFHEQIAAASNNAELLHALRLINVRLRFARRIVIEMRDRDGVFSDHRKIAQALRSRDATRACEILEKHIMLSRDDALKVAREGFARIYAGAER